MKNKINIICMICMILIIINLNLVSAEIQSLGTFKKSSNVTLKQIGAGFTSCYVTSVLYPNSSCALCSETEMTKNGVEYSLQFDKTSELGQYIVNGYCTDGSANTVWAYNFEITPSGFDISESQGLSSLGLLISIILISALFMFLGYKFSEADKTFPIGLFFLVISLLLTVYALHLGYIYTRDILYPIAAEGVQFKVYLGVMWGLIAIIFITMLFLILKVLKEIKIRKSLVRYGEGWNPRTKQYEY